MKKMLLLTALCGTISLGTVFNPYAQTTDEISGTKNITISSDKKADNKQTNFIIGNTNISLNKDECLNVNDHILLPIRKTAEMLGYKVEWNGNDKSLYIDNGEFNTTVYIGWDNYFRASSVACGMTSPISVGVAPTIVDGVSYAPIEMFMLLTNTYKFTLSSVDEAENQSDPNYSVIGGEDKITDIIIVDDGAKFDYNYEIPNQMPNPFTEYDTVDNAKKALKFDAKIPSYVTDGYKTDYISTLEDNFLQIIYKSGDNEITYRTAENYDSADDISGDYNVYKDISREKIGSYDVTLRKNGDVISAIWSDGETDYSVYSDGISIDELKKIITSIG